MELEHGMLDTNNKLITIIYRPILVFSSFKLNLKINLN